MANPEIAYIGLGSNLESPIEQLLHARAAIAALPETSELGFSPLYRNPPMGPKEQPDYINAVMGVETALAPLVLLHALQQIELDQGRVRTGTRWGPRTLDLDLLLYGQHQIDLTELTVPHPGVAARAFVLIPLRDIAPDLHIPGRGAVGELAARLDRSGMERIDVG